MVINSPKRGFRVAAVLFGILAAAIIIASTSLRGQVSRSRVEAQVGLCSVDAKSPACLEDRINQLQAQVAVLQEKVDHLQQSTAAVSSIGNPQTGKADGYDDIWTAIQRLTNEVKALEKR